MQTVLVALDLSKDTDDIIDFAVDFVRKLNLNMTLLHVFTPVGDMLADRACAEKSLALGGAATGFSNFVRYDVVREQVASELRSQHQRMLTFSKMVRSNGLSCRAILTEGPVVEAILREAELTDACMIVMGNHGHGRFYKAFLGSCFEEVVEKSEIPVVSVPQHWKKVWEKTG